VEDWKNTPDTFTYLNGRHTNITGRAAMPPRMALSTLGVLLFYQTSVIKSMVETPGEAFSGLLFSAFYVNYWCKSVRFRRNWAKNADLI
jgi:hypothetical protein